MGLNLGKQKKLWNKGHDGMMVGCGHKSRVGVFRMCDLETRKTHDTRNARWMEKLHKDCVKEDAVSEEESSKSDSTKNKKNENNEEETEEESLDGMAEVTETEETVEQGS